MALIKFAIGILWIIIVLYIPRLLGVPVDLISLTRDLFLFLGNKVIIVFIAVGALFVITFLNRISVWIGTTETPNEPQKIVLFTKETPAQIVNAANDAKRNIVLAFAASVAVFLIVVYPSVLESLLHLDLLRTVGLTRISPNPSTAPEPQAASPVLSTLTPTPAVTHAVTPAPLLTSTSAVMVIPSATPLLKPSTMVSRTIYIIIITTADP